MGGGGGGKWFRGVVGRRERRMFFTGGFEGDEREGGREIVSGEIGGKWSCKILVYFILFYFD